MRGATTPPSQRKRPGGFQSTLPMRGATLKHWYDYTEIPISIHAPHAGSDEVDVARGGVYIISIHAPHAGSDLDKTAYQSLGLISIHAPHAGSDNEQLQATCDGQISIHAPHAGSDYTHMCYHIVTGNFNPRSPCGERPGNNIIRFKTIIFQSTLPMRGATPCNASGQCRRRDFNPRSPCGERPTPSTKKG